MFRRSWAAAGLGGIGLVALLIAASFWLSQASVWLLWALLPPVISAHDVAAVYSLPHHKLLQQSLPVLPLSYRSAAYYETIAPHIPFLRQGAVFSGEVGTVVAALPSAGSEQALADSLRQYGFTITRVGPFVWATQPAGAASPRVEGLRPDWRAVWGRASQAAVRHKSIFPPLIFGQRGPISWQIFEEGSTWRLVVGDVPAAATKALASPQELLLIPEDEVRVILPGSVFQELPKDTQKAWDEVLAASLGFTESTPSFLEDLSVFSQVYIKRQVGNVLVGVEGNPDEFLALAEQWWTEEERRARPVTRGFRLPDGSVGFERVPGEPRDLFSSRGPDGCFRSVIENFPYKVCSEGTQALLLDQEAMPTWETSPAAAVSLGAAFWREVALVPATAVEALAGEHWLTARLLGLPEQVRQRE